MKNSGAPEFIYSDKQKNLPNHYYFKIKELPSKQSSIDDYILLKKWAKENPIVDAVIRLFGCRIVKE